MSRRRFASLGTALIRPREGDLVYIPLLRNFFEISFVEHENNQAMYYTLGRGRGANVYVYALKMKQFVFSNEIVETGVREVDEQIRDAYPRTRISLLSGSGNFVEDEIVYQGANLAYATAQAVVHNTTANSFIDIIRVSGSFLTGNVHGNTSSSNWSINTVSDTALMNTAFEDIVDNARIQSEADGILDFTEHNPFGEP